MTTLKKYRGVITMAVIFVLAISLYNFFAPSVFVAPAGPSARERGANLVSTYERLQSVTFDQTLLAMPGYRALTDFATEIPNGPVGRSNPFDLLGR